MFKNNVHDDIKMVKINKMMLQAVGGMKQLQDLKSFDLVFFHVLEGNHFYVIVFEFKNPAIYLLDNMQHGVSPVTYKDDSDYHKKKALYDVIPSTVEEPKGRTFVDGKHSTSAVGMGYNR
ncbi:hypothetical protein E3N88_15959 [Mikania micrantha]|uniref:Uncharacterized protein n=1 Tax=Mikania micrantha TaxID=192012 RepID=A0A5N6NX35_9ASTR|nr:hypothetical protein E3N88_15959 [Mikania micrantha]